MKVKKLLICQPAPESDKSPFAELMSKHKVEVDFRPFINIIGTSVKDFRAQRVDILSHTAVIFTSRKNIDNFFRLCTEMRITVPDTLKYFCVTEAIALYLQKYIVYRKRKIFYGPGTFFELLDVMAKHKTEKYMMALSEPHKPEVPQALTRAGFKYSKIILTHAEPASLSDIDLDNYDVVACYSPADIKTLLETFPQIPANISLATLGTTTAREAMLSKLRVDVMAPTPRFPSLTMALDKYIAARNAGESLEEFGLSVIPEAPSYKKATDKGRRSGSTASKSSASASKSGTAAKSTAAKSSTTVKKAPATAKSVAKKIETSLPK